MSKKPEWAEALDRLLSQRVETVPPGWKTAREVGEQLGVCYEMAKLKCAELVAAGLAERKNFRVKWGRGIRGLPHFRLVNNPARGRKPG
jgi:predicted ArsR family transcriptional regulator